MKKFFTIILFLIASFGANAQKMSVKSFDIVANDLDARVNYPKLDFNGDKSAIIKVETTEKGFGFDAGQIGIVDVLSDKIAETWVYIPSGAIRLKIQHPKYGTLNYEFPIAIKAATVYCLKLSCSAGEDNSGDEMVVDGQFFVLKVSPDNAEVIIDNDQPVTITDGTFSKYLSKGQHTYSVKADMCKTEAGVITIGDSRVDKSITLKANYAYLEVTSSTPATVRLNGIEVGKTPYKSGRLELGNYSVQLSAPNYDTYSQNVILSESLSTKTISCKMTSILAAITINSTISGGSIYINDEYVASSSWSGGLSPGEHIVRYSMSGYKDVVKRINVVKGVSQSVKLDAPQPRYGSLRVDSKILDVDVIINGKTLGKTPNIFSNILVGEHKVTFSKSGYATKTVNITINEGELTRYSLTMTTGTAGTTALKTTSTTNTLSTTSTATGVFKKSDYAAMGSPTTLIIPDGYTELEEDLFYKNTNIISVTLPNSVTKINSRAFYGCSALKYIYLSSSVSSILGGIAFCACPNLEIDLSSENKRFQLINKVLFDTTDKILVWCPISKTGAYSIPDGVVEVGWSAFNGCDKLTSVRIPNNVTLIDGYAFKGCEALTSVNMPTSLKEIGQNAFESCKALTSIKIPSSVTKIGKSVFNYCYKLSLSFVGTNSNFVWADGLLYSKNRDILLFASYVDSKVSYSLPNTLKDMGYAKFNNNDKLSSISIPNSVTVIEGYAFNHCDNLSYIRLPNTITSIGERAFSYCPKLLSIEIPDSVTEIGDDVFLNCAEGLTIHISANSPIYAKLNSVKDKKYKLSSSKSNKYLVVP